MGQLFQKAAYKRLVKQLGGIPHQHIHVAVVPMHGDVHVPTQCLKFIGEGDAQLSFPAQLWREQIIDTNIEKGVPEFVRRDAKGTLDFASDGYFKYINIF